MNSPGTRAATLPSDQPLTAVTICLVPAARHGPFVFHEGLEAGCRAAAELGFAGVEIFADGAAQLQSLPLEQLLREHGLRLAALGTGAGWLMHRLSLTDPDADRRERAVEYVLGVIDRAGECGAPTILGSMQGRIDGQATRREAQRWLFDALARFGQRAERHGQFFLYEALNRYETNLFNRQREAADAIAAAQCPGVKLLCDLFHMSIEEVELAETLRELGPQIGHVHWADSNRLAMGWGHTPATAVGRTLRSIDYCGWLSAEIFPIPDAMAAARQSQLSMRYAWQTAATQPVLRNPE